MKETIEMMPAMKTTEALRKTKHGQLKYHRQWDTPSTVAEISANLVKLTISPKALTLISESNYRENGKKFGGMGDCPKISDMKSEISTSQTKESSDLHLLASHSETELLIKEYDEERILKVKETVARKQSDNDNCCEILSRNLEQQLQLLKTKYELDVQRKSAELRQIKEMHLKRVRETEIILKEQHKTQARRLSAKVKEYEMKQRQLEEETRKRAEEQQERKLKLKECQRELHSCIQQTIENLQGCEHKKYLLTPYMEVENQLKDVLNTIDKAVEESKLKSVEIEDLTKAQFLLDNAQKIYQNVAADIDQARNKGQQESEVELLNIQKKREEAKRLQSDLGESLNDIKRNEISHQEMQQMEDNPSVKDENMISLYIATDAVHDYYRTIENLKQWEQLIQPFLSNTQYKKYRFELQKAVNTPINAISSVSGSHLKDKLDRLSALLLGQIVEVGGKRISCKEHPLAINFCKNLLARKLVMQGESQVASNYESAFTIAAVIVGLWSSFPDIGQLLMAHFYSKCPYLIPYYVPRQEGQSAEDYYRALGYIYDDKIIEKQDKFLKRMSGIMRLYAAIIQSSLPPSCKPPHPHAIEQGWKWLTRVLNMEPRPDITATLLFDFLDIAGHSLQKTYGKQFQKLLHALCKDYFPKIKKVTPIGSGGPLSRLEDFLHSAIKKGKIVQPQGILSTHFWYS